VQQRRAYRLAAFFVDFALRWVVNYLYQFPSDRFLGRAKRLHHRTAGLTGLAPGNGQGVSRRRR